MEFEDVSEKVEWEARRVAAAFGLGEWEGSEERGAVLYLLGWVGHHCIRCFISYEPLRTYEIGVGKADSTGTNFWHQEIVLADENLDGEYDLMARGLYRLGFENEEFLSQLPQLSAHEKLELRLSMPREFWPQKWLDEEGVPTGKGI